MGNPTNFKETYASDRSLDILWFGFICCFRELSLGDFHTFNLRWCNASRKSWGRPNAVEHEHYSGACETCTTSVKRAQLLWKERNFCETCTTAGKPAQHLWHAHNISETCTYRILENTGWGRWNTLFPYIYIYFFFFPFKPPFIRDFRCHVWWPVAIKSSNFGPTRPPKSPCSFSKAAHGSTMQMKFCGTMPT